MRAGLAAALAGFALTGAAPARFAPDTPEAGSLEAIARFTTDPRFVSPWVAYVPASSTVPSPTRYLGHVAGAAGELTHAGRIQGYFRELARASPRVRVQSVGRSEEGREIVMAAIADEAGIRDLDRLRAATATLADPRRCTPEQAEALVAAARPIYYFNASLHADETGSAEMAMELAYRLAVSEQPMIRRIRERLVVLVNPVSEPDGRDKMVDWYYRYLKGRADYGALPRQSPPYWGKYVFVDVNRDAHQLAFAATRAVARVFHEWHPVVVHDLHEAIPLLHTWNGTGPYNPNLDPIVTAEFLEMSLHEVRALTALGMPGVATWSFGEGFGHHYLDSVAMNHNAIGRGYETFGNATAETVVRTIEEADLTREWYRPLPPPQRTFSWSLRDNVNYAQTAALAALDHVAGHAEEFLRNFYRKGYNSWRAGALGTPRAFVVPQDQGDRRRVAEMVNRLRDQRIEVSRAESAFTLAEGTFAAGDYVVRLDQPYRNYAVDLLLPQRFPADSPHLPYDDVSWSLPVHYGLTAVAASDARIAEVAVAPLGGPAQPRGSVRGGGDAYLLADTGQEALLAARARLAAFRVEVADLPFAAAGRRYPRGSWVVPAQGGLAGALSAVAEELALDFEGVGPVPDVPRHEAPLPRIGVLVPWADTDSIGWLRYALDQRRVPYVYLRDEDVRAGGLRGRVDVIVYGQVRLDLQAQIHGIPSAWGPMPFTRTPEYPSHGTPMASDDITGGPGWAGLGELQRFVEGGGLLVTLGSGTALALEGGLVRGVRRASVSGVRTPGVELRARFTRPDHPLAHGYPAETSVFRTNLPLYDAPRRWLEAAYCTSCLDGPEDRTAIVLEWGGAGEPMVVSGGARGESELAGRPALLDLPVGQGRVIAFNFNPVHRDMNRSDHRLLWNALLNWRRLLAR
ncbi:MAG TPA: M14 family zinc carboxypeptidase [Vicinamibacteria bacterium]|nr:M14 family zinc carboxypeptidase [Vicinamibacteria bacterium]